VALIRWGTTEAQEVRMGTLGDIVGRARGLEAPVVAVIGEVVRLRDRLAWTDGAAIPSALGLYSEPTASF
jgi:siroheme synthase